MNNSQKNNRITSAQNAEIDVAGDLESQFILRLPQDVAESLKQTLRSGVMNLKDRMSIQLENDVRHGSVRFDNWNLGAKVLDLPTVIESWKTIDNKSFYKTADVCQILICKEGEDNTTDEETPVKPRKKDPLKVDKKFLYPHGVTPPLKNVRRRRFRKTLKKKFVEAPEIEKEVKRLLRVDNEAVSVRWELMTEEDEAKAKAVTDAGGDAATVATPLATGTFVSNQSRPLAEHEIFGEALSDSDEDVETGRINVLSDDDDEPDDSLSADNSRAVSRTPGVYQEELVTRFSKDMFHEQDSSNSITPSPRKEPSREKLLEQLEKVRGDLRDLQARRAAQEAELASIDNAALRQRLTTALESLNNLEQSKQAEYNRLVSMLP